MTIRPVAAFCVLILHTPGGTELHVDTRGMTAWQSLTKEADAHVAPGIKTIIDSGGKRYGVTETIEQIDEMRDRCGED